jgi:hypothetical protein
MKKFTLRSITWSPTVSKPEALSEGRSVEALRLLFRTISGKQAFQSRQSFLTALAVGIL